LHIVLNLSFDFRGTPQIPKGIYLFPEYST
jgi:hypothetical protein